MPLGAIHLLLTEVIPRLIHVQPGSSSLMKKKKKKRRRSTIIQDVIELDTEEDTDEDS